jgi:hypothetical protein
MVPYTERGLLSVALKNASNYLQKYQAITDSQFDTIFKKISSRKKMGPQKQNIGKKTTS